MEILVVEDDERIRALLALSLQEAGFTVVEANRAEAALTRLQHGSPALILLDLGIPAGAMSGVEALAPRFTSTRSGRTFPSSCSRGSASC